MSVIPVTAPAAVDWPRPALQRAARGALQQQFGVANGEAVAALRLVQLVPVDRRRHRRALAGPCAIGHDRRRPALVAQIVDEDPSFALHLGEVGGEAIGLGRGQRNGEALGEILDLRPLRARDQRHHHVQPLAAGQHREALQPHVGQNLAQVLRGAAHLGKAKPLVRIEVED
jgi:hypothetical protein